MKDRQGLLNSVLVNIPPANILCGASRLLCALRLDFSSLPAYRPHYLWATGRVDIPTLSAWR